MSTGELTSFSWEEAAREGGTSLVYDPSDTPDAAWAMIRRFADDMWHYVVAWGATGTPADSQYDITFWSNMRYFPIADPATIAWLEMLGIHGVSWQTWNAACHKVTGVPVP